MTTATVEAPTALKFMPQATAEQIKTIDTAVGLVSGSAMRVRSGAGSGKTTTLLGIARAQGRKRGIYLAYNSSVASDAAPKFSETNCKVQTFHALCYRGVSHMMQGGPLSRYDVKKHILEPGLLDAYQHRNIPGWKLFKLALATLHTIEAFCHSADKTVTFAHAKHAVIKQTGDPEALSSRGPRLAATRAIKEVAPILVDVAQKFWDMRMRDMQLTHDAYVKVVHLNSDLSNKIFQYLDYVMIDEAQDMNPVQVSILRATGITLIAVGDSAQSIHGWRGAVDALEHLPGLETQLSRSFRFGPNIATLANRVLDANPLGSQGVKVTGTGGRQALAPNRPQYAVLARSNIGLLEEAISLHRKGHSYHFDRGEDILNQIKSAQALREGNLFGVTAQEIRPFRSWQELLSESESNPSLERIVSIITENRVAEAEAVVRASKTPDRTNITLMTAHRSKGLEFGVVKLAEDWTPLHELATRVSRAQNNSAHRVIQARQEYNVLYVALTRAIQRIVMAPGLV